MVGDHSDVAVGRDDVNGARVPLDPDAASLRLHLDRAQVWRSNSEIDRLKVGLRVAGPRADFKGLRVKIASPEVDLIVDRIEHGCAFVAPKVAVGRPPDRFDDRRGQGGISNDGNRATKRIGVEIDRAPRKKNDLRIVDRHFAPDHGVLHAIQPRRWGAHAALQAKKGNPNQETSNGHGSVRPPSPKLPSPNQLQVQVQEGIGLSIGRFGPGIAPYPPLAGGATIEVMVCWFPLTVLALCTLGAQDGAAQSSDRFRIAIPAGMATTAPVSRSAHRVLG